MELTRLRRLSTVLRWVAAIAALNVIIWVLRHIVSPTAMAEMVHQSFGDISANGVTFLKHVNLSILAVLLIFPTLRALHMLWRLFTLYAQGFVLSQKAATTLKSLGRAILMMGIAALIAPTIATLMLTIDNPPGDKQFTINLSSNVLALGLFGGLITTIGWAMTEAARVDADNKAII